jgi:signal transduction histidine kinase
MKGNNVILVKHAVNQKGFIMENKWFSVKNKLILFTLLLSLVPILLIAYFANGTVRTTTEKDYLDSSLREINKVDHAISLYFQSIEENVRLLATDPRVRSADSSITSYKDIRGRNPIEMTPSNNGEKEQEIFGVLSHFGETHPNAMNVYIGTADGGYVQYPEGPTHPGYDPRKRPWYLTAVKKPAEVQLTNAYVATGIKEKIISNVVTIQNGDNQIGVLGMDVSLKGLTRLIKDIKIGDNGYVILTQSDGTIIAHPKKTEMNFRPLSDLKIPELDIKHEGSFEAKVDGKQYVFNTVASDNYGWKYIAVTEKSELLATADQIEQAFLIIGVLVVVAAIVVAVFISLRIMNKINKMANEMRRYEKLKTVSEIAASISHEVRNPLTVIKGFLQLLKEPYHTEEEKNRYLKISLEELERAEVIITDYLTFAKPSLENIEVLELAKELDYILKVVNPFANMHNVHIEVNKEENISIAAEAEKLHQCLINLLKNGIESMPEGGKITIDLKEFNSNALISIRDTGVGMNEEQIDRLGTPFYTTKDKGTGLGTMVVYSIVKAMHGKIKVESEIKKGTCFTITIPTVKKDPT